jgi:hypothetical protein
VPPGGQNGQKWDDSGGIEKAANLKDIEKQ